MKPTSDDWYPNFPNSEVMLLIYVDQPLARSPHKVFHRIVCRGYADFGLERDYFGPDKKSQAEAMYTYLSKRPKIDQMDLKIHGFKSK